MGYDRLALRVAAALAAALAASFAFAQERPADLTELPPVPTDYTPGKTAWGDWDFTATYQIEYMNSGRILFQRPEEYGNRVWVTEEEFARRLAAAEKSDAAYSPEGQGINYPGSQGLAEWMRTSAFGHRTSLLVSPANGQLPPMTAKGRQLFENGRSGWVPGQEYDWVSDFDTWDRCITRGFPASMFPNRYNNGIRVWQTPGYIVIQLEMLGMRIIPIGDTPEWPAAVEQWMGHSRAHWDGKTLVIETSNITSGDSVTHDPYKRSAAPVIVTMIGGAPFDTIPMSDKTRVTERLTMTGPNTLMHELTYSDPETFTAPWTSRIEWVRDDDYKLFEYACHEGDVQIRNYITASRAKRRGLAAGTIQPDASDDRSRFTQVFDRDPGVAPTASAPAAASAEHSRD
ncbi:MAG: hypothetical protein J0I69_03485 [Altererythrobacter sp.]|nr:hypothetical protein [Altererythrobacter sp.]